MEINRNNSIAVRIINSLSSDALFLANLSDVKNFNNLDEIKSDFLQFSISKKIYDQVRFLDFKGLEKVRINWNNNVPEIVANENLQNKKERYYYKDSMNLKRGEIFISKIDLNIENNEIEKPFKPMIRIGTPVFNYKNEKIGVIILNYLAKDLINELKKNVEENYSYLEILNQDGYWIYSNSKEDEWGFMFPDKENKIFENKYSKDIWNIITQNKKGQLHNDLGIFTYTTIYPLDIANSLLKKTNKDFSNYNLTLVSFISKNKINKILFSLKKNYMFLWINFFIFSLSFCYFLTKNIIKRREAETKYKVLFQKAGESIVVLKKENTVLANSCTEALFGYQIKEIINKPIESLFCIEDREKITNNQIKQIQEDIETIVFEAKIKTKNGKEKYTEIRSTKIDFQGEIILLYFFLDITNRKILENKLIEFATKDTLTNCYNRRYFTEELKNELIKSRRINYDLSVIMMDIDYFKRINDTYGHDIGDIALKKFVDLINQEIRSIDILGRLGGEEFAVFLPNCSEKNAFDCSERIRLKLEKNIIQVDSLNEGINFTVSFGIATAKEKDNVESLLKKVDKALYLAKKEGRNKSIIFKD